MITSRKLLVCFFEIFMCTSVTVHCVLIEGINIITKREEIESTLKEFNKELTFYRHVGAELAWNMSINMTQDVLDQNEKFTIERNIWNNEWCTKLLRFYYENENDGFSNPWSIESLRQLYLICRGPRFTSYQLSNILAILSSMQKLYNKEVCIDGSCMKMEPDLNRLMETSRNEERLKKVWMKWHETIGSEVKPLYISLVHMLNEGARQAGHRDMGQCWREETEIGNLRSVALRLYSDVKYLYKLLHTFVRFKIEKLYKMDLNHGPIPAHLLGNMYAQNWQSLIDIVWEDDEGSTSSSDEVEKNPLLKSLLPQNATVTDMVKAAEGFFVSMGLPKLPATFWKNSYFEDEKKGNAKSKNKNPATNARNCHGSAANMFQSHNPDYRMMMCAEVKDEDMITFQHEIGHIVYFMAYENLPTIFKDGANSAFHEAVGDSVTYDLKPHGFNEKMRMKSLLKTGLAKLPQIGFGLVMDVWRWNVFENEDLSSVWNDEWWRLNYEYLGIKKPDGYNSENNEDRLDAAGKFHIIDNIPYIRYFLGSFLQIQFYESMCNAAGSSDMHFCQIRNSKAAGSLLWRMMSRGTSAHWSEILEEMTGTTKIRSEPLLRYFEPLKIWLEKKVEHYNLTLGW